MLSPIWRLSPCRVSDRLLVVRILHPVVRPGVLGDDRKESLYMGSGYELYLSRRGRFHKNATPLFSYDDESRKIDIHELA